MENSRRRWNEGDILLAFTAYHLNVIVHFRLSMFVRLKELPWRRWRWAWRERYKDGAYRIADRLSDRKPEKEFTWEVSPVINYR